jgi:predicted transcriptional regulator
MSTHNTIRVSDELLAELQTQAEAEGRTVDELAEEALRKGLEGHVWQDLLAYGRENGRHSGYQESDVPELVRDWRREQRSR